jgi:hypothetical protein
MAMPNTAIRTRRRATTFGLGALVVVGALLIGSIGFAETVGGALLIWLSIMAGAEVTRRVVADRETGKELIWDLVLVLIVLAGLIGVGLMAQGLG